MKKNKRLNTSKVPVLFIIFNRPNLTERVFVEIKKYKPKRLFIAADGPRVGNPGDIKKCNLVRGVVDKIDWPCKVEKLFRKKNLGCKEATSSAIDWFFKNVTEGIVLEDDCLPNTSFFKFCEKMLVKYRNQDKIFHIGGNNFLPKQRQRSDAYYFSKYPNTWGWASWKRAWDHYDYNLKNWPKLAKTRRINKHWNTFWEKTYWTMIFDFTYRRKSNAWDYQWLYTIWSNNAKSITPGVNLVENIGLNDSGTHINTNTKVLRVKAQNIDPTPKLLSKSFSNLADYYASRHVYRISPTMIIAQWIYYSFKTIK